VFVFRDLQLGHLSKEQVVTTIVATNMGAGVFRGGKLIYNFDYTNCVRADLQSRMPLIVRTVIETRCGATHLELGHVRDSVYIQFDQWFVRRCKRTHGHRAGCFILYFRLDTPPSSEYALCNMPDIQL